MDVQSWILATRPKTLTAAFVPVLVGTVLAQALTGKARWDLAIFALLSSFFIQIGTNLVNDAIDFHKGADNENRLGPKRVTQSGLLTPRQVMLGAFLCFAVAMIFGIPLVIAGGWVIVAVGLVSLLLAYGYTGGPFPLAYLGLGDLFVFIFFGLIAVGGMWFLHTGTLTRDALVAGAQIGLLATTLIAINNLRDHEGDRLANKRTLAVRWGVKAVRKEILFLCYVPFALNLYWIERNLPWTAWLTLLAVPLAKKVVMNVQKTEPGVAYNGFLAQAAGLHLAFGVLWSVGALLK